MKHFWETKSLEDMTREEWESLCDGCGKCCLHKLEDEETGEVYYTDVVCRYLDEENRHCTCYGDRTQYVPGCVWLTPDTVREFHWLPESCAYRRVALGQPLPSWHHLLTGSRDTVREEGASVSGRMVNELNVPEDEVEEHIVHWVTQSGPG